MESWVADNYTYRHPSRAPLRPRDDYSRKWSHRYWQRVVTFPSRRSMHRESPVSGAEGLEHSGLDLLEVFTHRPDGQPQSVGNVPMSRLTLHGIVPEFEGDLEHFSLTLSSAVTSHADYTLCIGHVGTDRRWGVRNGIAACSARIGHESRIKSSLSESSDRARGAVPHQYVPVQSRRRPKR
jgi:hypothetical protein